VLTEKNNSKPKTIFFILTILMFFKKVTGEKIKWYATAFNHRLI